MITQRAKLRRLAFISYLSEARFFPGIRAAESREYILA
jgi:hypothetical protein